MTKFKFWMIAILAVGIVFTSCNSDDDVNESLVLVEYLQSSDNLLGKDYANSDMPSLISVADVNSLVLTNTAYLIDLRSAEDFAAGRIAGAVNVTLGDLLTHVQSINMEDYEKVVVLCYTGQTSSYGTVLLRLQGYDKVFSMTFGMCAWHEDFSAKWFSAIGNNYAAQFTSDVTEKGPEGDLPVLSTGKSTGQDILDARVNSVLAEGFSAGTITNTVLFANLEDYYIINYWPLAQYLDPGHIPGAIQYTPKVDMALDVNLLTLPTDKPIVVYCYTGTGSAFLTAYLRTIGYDAKSLLYGANAMIYDIMEAAGMTTFSQSKIMNYDYVTE